MPKRGDSGGGVDLSALSEYEMVLWMYDGMQERNGWLPSDIDKMEVEFIFDQIVARARVGAPEDKQVCIDQIPGW